MPDIFGLEPNDYKHTRPSPGHNFVALGAPPTVDATTEGQGACGYMTENALTIQTMANDVLTKLYRLDRFIPVVTDTMPAAIAHGRSLPPRPQRASQPKHGEVPGVSPSGLVSTKLFDYGLDAEWSIDAIRGAMFGKLPLDTMSIEAAVVGSLETMEAVALGQFQSAGILNWTADQIPTTIAGKPFSVCSPKEACRAIRSAIRSVVRNSEKEYGRDAAADMVVMLPGDQYFLLSDTFMDADETVTVIDAIRADNPWITDREDRTLHVECVLGAERMVVAIRDERVYGMVVRDMPHVFTIKEKGRMIGATVSATYSDAYVNRPASILYVDKV